MSAHTPWPSWEAESCGEWMPGYWQVHTATGKPRLIANGLSESDARLIAAAPALLEALEGMLTSTKRVIESGIDSDIWYRVTRAQEQARAAIRAAKGEGQ